MNSITWEPSFAVGHESIDAQHRFLFELMDKVHTAITSRHVHGDRTAERLVSVLADHFRFENNLMRDLAYPQEESHRKYHQRMLETVSEVMERWEHGEDARLAFDEFLKQWYYHHTSGADQNLGRYLAEHS
jgi:hemerythrin